MSDFSLLMNGDSVFVENENVETIEGEKMADSSERKFKIIKIIFCILCLILFGELIIYKYIMPSFESPKVTVNGQKNYSAEEIAIKLLPMNSTSWFDFDIDQAVSLLSSESGIEKVIIEKKFPDKIFIDVVERDPVAVTFIEENGRTNPVQIDKNGVLFALKNNEVLNTNEIPIISGLSVEHMSGGMRISSKYRPLIEQILKIKEMGKNYFAGISEICVLPKETGTYELELIPSQAKTKVLTDRTLNEESLKYMMVVLDVIKLLDADVPELDLRYGSVSCKIR